MKYKTIEDLPGYKKLPKLEGLSRCKTTEEFDEYRRIEKMHQAFCKMSSGLLEGIPKSKIYTKKYYISLCRKLNNDENFFYKIYRDYAPYNVNILDRNFFSCYLHYGIQQIDNAFCEQIRKLGDDDCLFSYEELEECILRQPNLHPFIKSNLYYNLLARKNEIL